MSCAVGFLSSLASHTSWGPCPSVSLQTKGEFFTPEATPRLGSLRSSCWVRARGGNLQGPAHPESLRGQGGMALVEGGGRGRAGWSRSQAWLAGKLDFVPWTEEPGRLQSMGLLRLGHDRMTSLALFAFMHWRRKWQPTPVFLLGDPALRRGHPLPFLGE